MKVLNDVRQIATIEGVKETEYLSVETSIFKKELIFRNNHIVSEKELHRPDLLSQNQYENTNFWWIILLYNDITDPFEIKIGDLLRIPDIDGLREILDTHRRRNDR